MQHVRQGHHTGPVAAKLGVADVFDDHLANFSAAVVLGEKILGKRYGRNFG
jgi:hypothetical protein